jgi:copper resistance protein C
MNAMKLLALLGVCSVISPAALAHTDLASSSPIDGAVSNSAPPAIELNFNGDVQLLKLQIAGSNTGEVASAFKPSAAKQQSFVVALPALVEDTYTVNWTVLGADGHRVEKSFTFTVDAAAREQAGSTPAATSHAEHAH